MKIHAIGGYNEVGKNMSVLEIGEDAFIFDTGLFLPAIVGVTEQEKILHERGMRSLGALPDDHFLEIHNLQNKVRAILVSHAHLDHVGAIPYIAPRYKAPVLGTPYTMEVLKVLMNDAGQKIPNRIISVPVNGYFNVKGKKDYKVEFINMTHSTIQSSIIAVHTPEGIVLYANDYKLDNSPVFGEKPNYKRLKELAKQGVKALIVDCLYAPDDRKTPSEKIARSMMEEVFLTTDNRNKGMIVTTFSSHIARLKTITELGRRINRQVLFVGRSLSKYMTAAANVKQAPFKSQIQMLTYRHKIEKAMKHVNKRRQDYLIVCTGHQGEPGSVLDRISRQQFPFQLREGDHIIFSSRTIPAPINEINRKQLEERLRKRKVRIFDSIHVSGHGGREDLRELIKLVQPEHVIPSHGDLKKLEAGVKLAEELGYKINKSVHLLHNGKSLEI